MKRKVQVAIVGGGVNGCAIAYNLARLGVTDVAIYEKSHLAAGSTGRCGAGVRAQWGTEMNCRLSLAGIRAFETLPQELDYPDGIEFKQGGYLILAFTETQMEQFRKNIVLQNSLGIPSRLVTPAEAREIVPHLGARDLLGATFCAIDGHSNPFKVTDAYAQAARRLGVEINLYTEVQAVHVAGGRVTGLETTSGPVECETLVNAAGPYSQQIAAMAGLALPTYSQRHQVLVTEPVEPVQNPMVISFTHGVYCQQVPHGSFIIGVGDPAEPKGYDIGHSWQFLADISEKVNYLLPPLGKLRVVRQWSGLYNMSPDSQPILGPAGEPQQPLASDWLLWPRVHAGAGRRQDHRADDDRARAGDRRAPVGPRALCPWRIGVRTISRLANSGGEDVRLATKDELCSGCRTCQLVCALQNFHENNPKFAVIRIIGHFPKPGRYEVQVCDECGACRDVCPVEAIYDVNGHLEIDGALCTGCQACVAACPRGVITMHASWSSPFKCVHCGACAEYCPTGAIYDADLYTPEQAWRITRDEEITKAKAGGHGDE